MRVHQKISQNPETGIEAGAETSSEDEEYVPGLNVQESFALWRKDPAYIAAYEAEAERFDMIKALLRARLAANMTQEDVARAMGTTQAAIARLEGGGSMPSTRTLKRFAQATGHRLKISFEPLDKAT